MNLLLELIFTHWLVRQCTKCRDTKYLSEFSKNKTNKKHSWCKDCSNTYNKEYYERNKIKINEHNKEYRKNNQKKVKQYSKEYRKDNSHQIWARSTIDRHKVRGYKFKFTHSELVRLALKTRSCSYCNIEIDWSRGGKDGKAQLNSPSLDRINSNKKVFTLDDVVISCYQCGMAKSTGTINELAKLGKRLFDKHYIRGHIPLIDR